MPATIVFERKRMTDSLTMEHWMDGKMDGWNKLIT
jgi:hypothetical protein